MDNFLDGVVLNEETDMPKTGTPKTDAPKYDSFMFFGSMRTINDYICILSCVCLRLWAAKNRKNRPINRIYFHYA